MKNASIHHKAAEEMAIRARECQTTVQGLYVNTYHVSFRTAGHTDSESIEHSVNITPELIERAQKVLDSWNAA
jgi:hypothetical protein